MLELSMRKDGYCNVFHVKDEELSPDVIAFCYGYESYAHLSASFLPMPEKTWVLANVMVKSEFRNMGIGSYMLMEVAKYLDQNNIPCYLHVYDSNEPAIHIYEKVGFELHPDFEENTNAWGILDMIRYPQGVCQ